ncbi:MAG: hypothetical protein ABIJ08_03135 [Nanoarchaeota archaeon]
MASSAYRLEGFVKIMDSWGLTDILLPFLLIFAIVFAILQKTKILGEKKNINVIVALVMGLLVVVPHVTGIYPAGFDAVNIINAALPSVSIVLVAVVMLLILIGIMGADATMLGLAAPTWVAVISIGFIIFIFGGAAGWWGGYSWIEAFFGSDAMAIIVMLLVFGIIISFITGEGAGDDMSALKQVGINFPKLFGGGKGK